MIVPQLAGYTVAITNVRRSVEFAAALQLRGARVVAAPAMRIVPPSRDERLLAATKDYLVDPPPLTVLTSSAGLHSWLGCAAAAGLADQLSTTLRGGRLLAVGADVDAARAIGLTPIEAGDADLADAALELLAARPARRRRVAVQASSDALPGLARLLRARGAGVQEITTGRWLPPSQRGPLARLIEAIAAGALDCVAFTSAPAAASVLQTAEELGLGARLRAALRRDVVAACRDRTAADPLHREALHYILAPRPELTALLGEIVETVPALRGTRIAAAGHRLDVRGHAVGIDGRLVRLPPSSMTLLRELSRHPGHVVSRDALGAALAAPSDDHLIGVAIGRLRGALGDAAIVQTVLKRGYRLAVAS